MSIERELDHEIDDELAETTDLMTLSDEQENLLQMQELAQFTLDDGLLRLPVKPDGVTTTQDRTVWVVTVDHPVEGDIDLYVDKPVHGWHENHELPTLLRWYGIHDQDPYKLQLQHVAVEYQGDGAARAHGWELVEPPWYVDTRPDPPIREQLATKWENLKTYSPGAAANAYGILALSVLTASAITWVLGPAVAAAATVGLFFFATIFAMAVTSP